MARHAVEVGCWGRALHDVWSPWPKARSFSQLLERVTAGGRAYRCCMQLTHGACERRLVWGLNPPCAYKVKNWASKFCFQRVSLYRRYSTALDQDGAHALGFFVLQGVVTPDVRRISKSLFMPDWDRPRTLKALARRVTPRVSRLVTGGALRVELLLLCHSRVSLDWLLRTWTTLAVID